MKKITALLTAVLLAIATCLPVLAGDDTGKISVTLRIEGINGNISCKTYTTGKTNMAEFIKEADAADDSFAFTIESSAYGDYVAAVNGENAGTFRGYDGWCFLVNGELPPVGMSSVTLEDGDSIVFYYSCDGMQIPRINTDRLSEGIITWTSDDTTYDASWNPVVTTNPVKGATVTWYSGETFRQYTTDDNGAVKIDSELLTAGNHKLTIEKKGENGEPLVLRYAPDFAVSVEKDAETQKETAAHDMAVSQTGDAGNSTFLFCVTAAVSAAAVCAAVAAKKKTDEDQN